MRLYLVIELSSNNIKQEKFKLSAMETKLKSFMKIFEFCGFQHFSLEEIASSDKEKRPTILRFFHMIFRVFLIAAVSCLVVVQRQESRSSFEPQVTVKNVVMHTIQASFNAGLILVCVSSIVESFVSTKKIKKVFKNVNQIVEIAQRELGVSIDFENFRKSSWKRLWFSLVFFSISHSTLTYFNRNEKKNLVESASWGISSVVHANECL
jgi:uncharacterized protein YbcV (DUF1398 family)